MTFLQPFVLWGLPLVLLPVLIHLLNRMRYRTQRWAAMSFLFSANRASTRYAKLRQFLLLACRMLALLALILAIARPLAGGWLGWALSPSPDVILVLLDRSASMETHDATNSLSRREQALRAIASAAAPFADRSRFVLMENVLRKPQEIAKPDFETLSGLAMTRATDTAADLPAMLDAAAEWLTHNQSGLTEIWIASDLQRTNWQPDSSRWAAVTARLGALRQTVRVRLLALTQPSAPNISASITYVANRERDGHRQIDLTLDLERADSAPVSLPIAMTLDDVRSHLDVAMQGQSMRIHHTFPLDPAHESGWGKIELPADANARDNTAYFVYGPKPPVHTALVAADEKSHFFLRFAMAPSKQGCDIINGSGEGTDWQKYAAVVWQGPLPTGKVAVQLQAFVERGGVAVFFPPGASDINSFAGTGWGAVEDAAREQPFRVIHWDEQDGALAKTDEGLSLPVSELGSYRRQLASGAGNLVASFADAKPFLTELALGHGHILFCATLPNPEWSTLGDGRVLVPMLQRQIELGEKRFQDSSSLDAGDPSLAQDPGAWTSIDAPKKDVRFDAGIYRNGPRLIAVNRPAGEDNLEVLEKAAAKRLFGALPVQLFEERSGETGALQGEIWRVILITMLIVLLVEGFLSLPQQSAQLQQKQPAPARAEFAKATQP